MKSIPLRGGWIFKEKRFEIEFLKERHEPVELPRAVVKKPLNPVSGERRIATGQGQQGVGGTAVSSNLGVSGGRGPIWVMSLLVNSPPGDVGGGRGLKKVTKPPMSSPNWRKI